jgi:hypothetical protein
MAAPRSALAEIAGRRAVLRFAWELVFLIIKKCEFIPHTAEIKREEAEIPGKLKRNPLLGEFVRQQKSINAPL